MEQILNDPKINEALDLINSSLRERKEMVQKLIGEKYGNIKDAINGSYGDIKGAMGNVSSSTKKAVQRKPLIYMGGIAVSFLIVGYFLGRTRVL